MTATYFPFLGFFVGVEVERAVKEEGPASVDYANINSSITLGSPVVAGQKQRAPIAVNRLDCAAYERWAGLLHYAMLLELSLVCTVFRCLIS